MLKDDIIPDWLFIVASVLYIVGLILLFIIGVAPEKKNDTARTPFENHRHFRNCGHRVAAYRIDRRCRIYRILANMGKK